MLLRHLTPSSFKTIRYCGFYRKKHKNHDKMVLMVNPVHHNNRKTILKYRLFCLKSFNRDPYSCPKCKYKFEAPIEAVLEFEEEDEWNGLPISTPPYTICAKCNFDKCVPIDYKSKRGYHHIYKEK